MLVFGLQLQVHCHVGAPARSTANGISGGKRWTYRSCLPDPVISDGLLGDHDIELRASAHEARKLGFELVLFARRSTPAFDRRP